MKSSFQTIILIVFGFAFVAAVAVFSGIFSSNTTSQTNELSGTVIVWGVLPNQEMQQYVAQFNGQGGDYSIMYEEHAPGAFAQDLTVALADDVPPDVVLVSSELFSQFKDKLYPIPYEVYSERAYRDSNVDGAQVFLTEEGVIAVPILVDPLVVFYNKDILAAANYALPPRTWDDLANAVSILTKRGSGSTITQSAIALGETANIAHFKDILSALFLQAGNPIVAYDAALNTNTARLDNGTAAVDVVNFYTAFSNPTNGSYTWNRSFPESLDMFISGRLAFYVGRASELFTIQSQNPNLNFDVIELFQPAISVRPLTFGSFIGASVVKASTNINAEYAFVASFMTSSTPADDLSKRLSLPPVRRDLLLVQQQNPYVSVFFKAALSAFSWPDPNEVATDQIFRAMIGDITSGKSDPGTAIYEAHQRLQSNIR